jgi:hypothetical protein
MATQLLICKCGDCDDWIICRDEKGGYIKCMTCGQHFTAKIEVEPHAKLAYEDEKPALERGRKMVPKGSRKRAARST